MDNISPYSLLTDHELQMIDKYRYNYANTSNGGCATVSSDEWCPVKELLAPWNEAKEILFKAFGNKLIISKHISYNRSLTELEEDFDNVYWQHNGNNPFAKFLNAFKNLYSDRQFKELSRANDTDTGIVYTLSDLLTLAQNRYPFDDGSCVTLANGKKYKIPKGAKVVRVIGKIANSYGIPGFEEFRQIHSQVLNQKKLEGNIVLSIHPLDYMTMSDNDCDWDSCMNWMGCGEYRMGTVEMMNSPCVVVAYLTAEHPFRPFCEENGYEWNNKKWRTLIISDRNFITNVCSYPYHNEFLAEEACKIMRDLMENVYPDTYSKEPVIYTSASSRYNLPESDDPNKLIKILWRTSQMYNDFSKGITRTLYYRKDYIKDCGLENPIVEYSGPAQCMCCGALYPVTFSEADLICCDCSGEEPTYCAECGDRIYDEEASYTDVNGNIYCEDCAYRWLVRIPGEYDYYHVGQCQPIDLIVSNDDGEYYCIPRGIYIGNKDKVDIATWNNEHEEYPIHNGTIMFEDNFTKHCNYIFITPEQYANYGKDWRTDIKMDHLFDSLDFMDRCSNIKDLFKYHNHIMEKIKYFTEND